MKICYIVNDLNRKAGTEKAVTLIANKMAEMNNDVSILSFVDVESPGYKINESINIINFNMKGKSLKTHYFEAVKRIRDIVKDGNFDYVVEAEVYNRLFTTYALRNSKTKIITWEHFNYYVTLGRKERAFARRLAARYSDAIVTLTELDKKNYNANLNCRGIVKAINNPAEFKPLNGCDYNSKNILAIGRFTYQKGFDILLKCWKKINESNKDEEWTLNIVGDGEDKEKLQQYIKEEGLESTVRLCEPTSEIEKYYLNSSIYVMTSRFEGLPMVLIEAMSFGLPVVSLNCQTGPSDLIEDGKNGFLCEFEDYDGFAEKVQELMKNTGKREVIGKEAKNIINKLDIDVITNKWLDLFEELGG